MSTPILRNLSITAFILTLLTSFSVRAQDYGPNVTLEQARAAITAAEAEAERRDFDMAIAVVDTAGKLVAFVRMDNTQIGSVQVAQDKAYTAAAFKRPSKALQDALAAGGEGLRVLGLTGVFPVEGGLPLIVDGKIIGAIGVSGGTSPQDGVVAAAGVGALE